MKIELMLVLGSGNITAGGHGKNHETFTTLYADSIDSLLLPILNEAWLYLQTISKKLDGYSRNRIVRSIPRNCELINSPTKIKHQFYKTDDDIELALIYNEETSIFNQILSAIPNDDIHSITIVSPYYDEDGALLLSILNEYPKALLNVFLPFEQGLPPIKIEDNNRISFYQWENTKRGQKQINASDGYKRKLHSKLFFFHSEASEYCMLGSANATIAAFGTKTTRGINDEFGVLYKSSKIDFLAELGIIGKRVKANPSLLKRVSWVLNSAPISKSKFKLIKIESCDLNGINIKCFCSFNKELDNVFLCIYDDIGEEILQLKTNLKLDSKILLRLNSTVLQNILAYVLFKDENNNIISNKQVINNIDKLFNTDPSKENRAIRRLMSALEIGKINEYHLLGYLNELGERDSKTKVVESTMPKQSIEEKSEAHSEMTFEEAMVASKNKTHSALLSTKHNAVQLWQSITTMLKERKELVTEELNDEEEDGDPTKSKERTTPDIEEDVFKVKDDAGIRRILRKTEQLTNYFVDSMIKLARDKEYEINEIVLCQFLLISHIITVIHQFNTYNLPYDKKKKKYKVYTPEQWSKILNDKYYSLMQQILMSISKMILSHSLIQIDDGYRAEKINSYIQEAVSYIFIYHYLINRNCQANPHSEMTDLACLNIVFKLGLPNDDFIDIIERNSKSKTTELFNTLGVVSLRKRVEDLLNKIENKDGVFYHNYYGVCFIKKIEEKRVIFKSVIDKTQLFRISKKDWLKL